MCRRYNIRISSETMKVVATNIGHHKFAWYTLQYTIWHEAM